MKIIRKLYFIHISDNLSGVGMNVLKKRTLLVYGQQYPDAFEPLMDWYNLMTRLEFANFAEMQATFTSVSWVGPEYLIFNIRGGRYRLITTGSFPFKVIRIKDFLTHQLYDRWTP